MKLSTQLREWLNHPLRRFRARRWRCRCGKRVFDLAALGSSPLAPKVADSRCGWHRSVRSQVLSGKIVRPEDAR